MNIGASGDASLNRPTFHDALGLKFLLKYLISALFFITNNCFCITQQPISIPPIYAADFYCNADAMRLLRQTGLVTVANQFLPALSLLRVRVKMQWSL